MKSKSIYLEIFYKIDPDSPVESHEDIPSLDELKILQQEIEILSQVINAKINCTNYYFKKPDYVNKEAERIGSLAHIYLMIERTLELAENSSSNLEITKETIISNFQSGITIEHIKEIFKLIKEPALKTIEAESNENNDSFYAALVIEELINRIIPTIEDREELIRLYYIKSKAMSHLRKYKT